MAELTPAHNAQDVSNNKVVAILAYFGILFLIPLFAAKDSPFARFHANQGAVLFIAEIVVYLVFFILALVLRTSLAAIGILGILQLIVNLGILVLAILGIINAAKGEEKELPVIGKYRVIK